MAPSSQLTALENCFTSSATCPVFGIPTGTVAFADGGTTINTAVLNAEGDAEYNAPFAIGSHSVTASYAGDNSYNKSTASAVTFTVVKDTPRHRLKRVEPGFSTAITPTARPPSSISRLPMTLQITITPTRITASLFPVPVAPPTGTVTVTGFPAGTTPTSPTLYRGSGSVLSGARGRRNHHRSGNNPLETIPSMSATPETQITRPPRTSFPVQFGSLRRPHFDHQRQP